MNKLKVGDMIYYHKEKYKVTGFAYLYFSQEKFPVVSEKRIDVYLQSLENEKDTKVVVLEECESCPTK
jgi:hypothetical protein